MYYWSQSTHTERDTHFGRICINWIRKRLRQPKNIYSTLFLLCVFFSRFARSLTLISYIYIYTLSQQHCVEILQTKTTTKKKFMLYGLYTLFARRQQYVWRQSNQNNNNKTKLHRNERKQENQLWLVCVFQINWEKILDWHKIFFLHDAWGSPPSQPTEEKKKLLILIW